MKSEGLDNMLATLNHAFSLRRMLETSKGNETDAIYRRKKLTGTSGEFANICVDGSCRLWQRVVDGSSRKHPHAQTWQASGWLRDGSGG